MRKLFERWKNDFYFDVYSGGMVLPSAPTHISAIAPYISEAYKQVEELSGVKYGKDYLWHIFNPDQSDWYPNSLKPAMALCAFKELYPDLQVPFSSDLQSAHYEQGRDLTDSEAYRHLLEKYDLPEEFLSKLSSEYYKEKAEYEFALVKQLHVTGFPTLFLQAGDNKFYMLARGYTSYETVHARMEQLLTQLT